MNNYCSRSAHSDWGRCLWLVVILSCASLVGLRAQRIDIDFGKNRVQHHDDFKYWNSYESEHFIIYYYGKSRNVAQSVTILAEYDHDEIVDILEYSLKDKIEMVVYLDVRDLHQSNLGIDEELFESEGSTHILGSKMFVYFDGSHQNLREQVRRGVASVYLNSLLFGSSLQDRVQNAISLDLPQWYKQGMIEYIVSPWDFGQEAFLREFFAEAQDQSFRNLSLENPTLAGHSFWYFISRKYGHSAIASIIYRIRTSRNIQSGFDHVLNLSETDLFRDWEDFYRNYFDDGSLTSRTPDAQLWPANKYPGLRGVRLNSQGDLIFTTNNLGKMKVYHQAYGQENPSLLWKSGIRTAMIEVDKGYPVVDFSPDGEKVLIIYENRNKIYYRLIHLSSGEVQENFFPEKIQRVLSLDFHQHNRFLLSVMIDGYSELIEFTPQNRQYKRYTSDYHDDGHPVRGRLGDKVGVFFESTRKSSMRDNESLAKGTVPSNHTDIYFLELEPRQLYQITTTPFVNESQCRVVGDTLYYLSDKLGPTELFALDLSSIDWEENLYLRGTSAIPSWTNLDFSGSLESAILVDQKMTHAYDVSASHKVVALSTGLESGLMYEFRPTRDLSEEVRSSAFRPLYNYWRQEGHESNEDFHSRMKYYDLEKENYTKVNSRDTINSKPKARFVTRFGDHPSSAITTKRTLKDVDSLRRFPVYKAEKKRIHDFRPVKSVAYKLSFGIEELTTKFNNDPLFGGLNTFAGLDDQFEPQPMGLLFRGRIRDVFEDYTVEVGARLQLSFDGAEYYVSFEDRSHLIDKKYSLYRRSQLHNTTQSITQESRLREVNYIGVAEFRYPFDFYSSLRAIGTLRWDQQDPLAVDDVSLAADRRIDQRIGLRLEYVYDNTLHLDLNQLRGARAKVFVESFNRFDLGLDEGDSFSASESFLTLVGFDARYYQGFLKHSVLALRATGGHSFGSEKILFHAGGVENWLFNSFDNSIPIPVDQSFAYRTTVSNLRGFRYNVRSGNTYALAHVEARIPAFKYLSRKTLRSPFLRSFMLVGFVDAGSAWYGLNPLDDENPQFTIVVEDENDPVSVQARYYRQPFVYGYGFGARALVLGYHIKADYGWGVDSGFRNDGRLFLSLGLDF